MADMIKRITASITSHRHVQIQDMTSNYIKSVLYGFLASGLLLGIYFVILTLVSGWGFAQDQFFQFSYFIVSLALGFGIQIGLYV